MSGLKSFYTEMNPRVPNDRPDLDELIAAAARPKDGGVWFDPFGLSKRFIGKYCEDGGNGKVRLTEEAISLVSKIKQDNRGRPYLPCVLLVLLCSAVLASEPAITVEARQRYPWNGMVDLSFTVTGDAGTKYDTSFVAKDVVGGTNLPMRTLMDANGAALSLTNSLMPGSYKWIWDAVADLPDGFACNRVTIAGDAFEVLDMSNAPYVVLDMTSGVKEYLASVPDGGWTSDPYRYTKMAFRRVRAETFQQGARVTTISKDFYISICTVTLGHLSKMSVLPIGSSADANVWFNSMYDGSPQCRDPYTAYWFYTGNVYWKQSVLGWMREKHSSYWRTSSLTFSWPGSGHAVVEESAIGMLRKKTGLTLIDLPTEAQLTLARKYVSMGGSRAWYGCLDWYGNLESTAVTDPVGPASGEYRVAIGSSSRAGASFGSDDVVEAFICINL